MSTPNTPHQPGQPQPYPGQQPAQPQQHAQPQPTPQQQYPGQQPTQAYPQQSAQYPQPNYPTPSTATTLDKTNTFALLAIILAFIAPIAGIVFGHMGLSQIKKKGDAGRGIALTGLIISYAYFVFIAFILIAYIGMIAVMMASFGSYMSDGYYY